MKLIVLCDSFHAVLAWSCGLAKCQCCIAKVMVVVYLKTNDYASVLCHFRGLVKWQTNATPPIDNLLKL